MNLSEDIQTSIKKNLPEMVASELQEHLKQADRTAAELKKAHERIVDLQQTVQRLESKIREQSEMDTILAAVTKKDEEASKKLEEARIKELNCRADVAEARFNTLNSSFTQVFANTIVRESVQKNTHIPVPASPPTSYNSSGTQAYIQQCSSVDTTTHTTEPSVVPPTVVKP